MSEDAAMTEVIKLEVQSPKVDLSGIDSLITRLEYMDKLTARLERRNAALSASVKNISAPGKVQPRTSSGQTELDLKGGNVKLNVLGSDVTAHLVGRITLNIPASDVDVRIAGGGIPRAPGGGGSIPGGVAGGPAPSSGGSYDRRRIITDKDGNQIGRQYTKITGENDEFTTKETYDAAGDLSRTEDIHDPRKARLKAERKAAQAKREAAAQARANRSNLREGIDVNLAYRKTMLTQQATDRIEALGPNMDPRSLAIERAKIQSNYHRQLAQAQKSQAEVASQGGDRKKAAQLGLASAESMRAAAVETERATLAQKRFDESSRLIGKNMLQNIAHVTTWAASVGVLYGSINLASHSLETMIQTGWQTARLAQVFRGSAAEAARLTDQVLMLASANGRSATEAMEAAIQWSRLGLSQSQAAEAVRVSLMAANVAQITAGEATEHLSMLYQVYHLHVSELANVLGELTAVSNTYNVTNASMLEGLTRVASIAKQAGMSLSELIGLIGAGVGATGQSGTMIGNAIKSITGSLNDSEVQKQLRQKYHVEVTAEGGNSVKGLSDQLSAIFVAYQRMGQAERQSMLFGVAGKQQASRMAALLDNYVKAQVLAITAQLNLNAAEGENARITATLKSQLEALTTEWGRFVNAQGGRGPNLALSETIKLMTNLMRIANTSVGSSLTTGFLGLFTAISAKLAVTTYQMASLDQKAGVVGNTFKAVRGAVRELGDAMAQTAARGGWLSSRAPVLSKMFGKTASGEAASSTVTRDSAGRIQSIAIAAGSASTGLTQMGKAAVFSRVALAGLVDTLLPLAAIVGVFYLINKGLYEMGVGGQKAKDQIEALDARVQTAGTRAEAAGEASRLFSTVGQAIHQPGKIEGKIDMLRQAAEAAFPPMQNATPEDESNRQAALKAEQDKLAVMMRANDLAGIDAELDALKTRQLTEQTKQRQIQYELTKQEDATINAALSKTTDPAKRAKLEEQLSANQSKRIQYTTESVGSNAEDLERFLAGDEKHQAYLERQKNIVSEISDLYQQMGAIDKTGALDLEIQRLQVVEDFHKRSLDNLNQQRKAMEDRSDSAQQESVELRKRADAKRDEAQSVRQSIEGDFKDAEFHRMPNAFRDERGQVDIGKLKANISANGDWNTSPLSSSQRKAVEDKIKRYEALITEAASIENQSFKPTAEHKRLTGKITEETTALEKARSQLDSVANVTRNRDGSIQSVNGAESEQERLAQIHDRRGIEQRIAIATGNASAVGDSEGAQFVAKQRFLEGVAEKGSGMMDELEARKELIHMSEEGEMRVLELKREQLNITIQTGREFQRSIMGAGPGEMLRKLSVMSIAARSGGRLSAGQFFAMGEGARGDWMQLHPERLNEINRSLTALRGAGYGGNSPEAQILGTRGNNRGPINTITGNLGPGLPNPTPDPNLAFNENAVKAANSLAGLSSSAAAAQAALESMASRLDTMFPDSGAGNVTAHNAQNQRPI